MKILRTPFPPSIIAPIMQIPGMGVILVLSCLFQMAACTPQPQQAVRRPGSTNPTAAFFHGEKPAAIKGRQVAIDSIASPVVTPLKGQPKRVSAHPNVHPAGQPEVSRVPDNLQTFTLGKDGVPLPKIVPVKGKVVPAKHPKPIPAEAFRTKDAAVYDIQYLSDEQGLKYPGIVCVLEDSRGHIWFGTTGNAAVRYDGEHFFEYTSEEGLVIWEGVSSMMEDSKGNIWFGGGGGVCYYDGHNFVQFAQEEVGQPRWGHFMEDSKGDIWFFTDNLVRYDGEKFTIYEKEYVLANDVTKKEGYFSNGAIKEIMEDSHGHIWIATSGNGAFRFDGQNFIQLTKEDGLVDNYISNILEDGHGNIWIGSGVEGTTGKGVSRFTPDASSPHTISGTLANFDQSHGLSGNRIQEILKDEVGNIWFATYDGGICQFDGKYFTHFTKEEGMSFDAILGMIKDSHGNLWAGTNGGGISKFKPNGFRHFSKKHGLGESPIGVGLEDRQGNIWMTNYYNGVHRYDGREFANFTVENGLLQNFVSNLMEDRDGNIWIVYRDKGASKFDGKNFTHYKTKKGSNWEFYWDIYEDSQGMIWFSKGGQGGVDRLDPATSKVTNFKGTEKICLGCASTYEDSQGDLWFGSRNHIAKWNKAQDQIEFVCQVDTLDTDWVDLMIEDKEGNVWFGSPTVITQVKQNGVILKDSFPRYVKGKELPNVLMLSAVYDRDGNLWIGSKGGGLLVFRDGLKHIGTNEFKWLQYGKADGLKNLRLGSGLVDSKNQLWMGATGHLTTIDLNTFRLPTEAPKNLGLWQIDMQQHYIHYGGLTDTAYRTALSFGGQLAESFDSVVTFKNYPANLTLPYDLNHLTFHFSADDWNAPHKIEYSYKMDGIDVDWSPPNSEAKAEYRKIPFGTYTFEVKAIGESRVWSEPIGYTFTIHPPWWHSWWAYALYVLLAVGAVGGYVMRLRRKIKQKQEQLEREQYLNRELMELNIATSRFVPSDFLKILDKNTLKELSLGDQAQATMTILFADIRDYTKLSEEMTPEQNFKFINAYLGRMGPIIQEHGGFICQYFGDGIMVLFKDNHDRALKAAIEMQQALHRYNRKRFAHDRLPIQVGIGVNTGQLMLGVIGDKQRYDSTVISDAVNTASRMEGLTKIFGCQVIASENTLQELQLFTEDGAADTLAGDYRFLGKVKVKGKEKIVKIYDFYDGETEEVRLLKSATKTLFEKALQLYYNKQFGKAADVFKVILEKYPSDVASNYYMDKSVKYIVNGVDANWSGVEEMVSK